MTASLIIEPGRLQFADLRRLWQEPLSVSLVAEAWAAIDASSQAVQRIVARGDAAYGINTGFGLLAKKRIPDDELQQLQRNLILSHSVGTGALLSDDVVRLALVTYVEGVTSNDAAVCEDCMQLLDSSLHTFASSASVAIFTHAIQGLSPPSGVASSLTTTRRLRRGRRWRCSTTAAASRSARATSASPSSRAE